MKTVRELELNLLVKEAHIQQLKLKNQELLSDNVDIAELNINLLNKINKAIEYIEARLNIEKEPTYCEELITSGELKHLLEILKDEDNLLGKECNVLYEDEVVGEDNV